MTAQAIPIAPSPHAQLIQEFLDLMEDLWHTHLTSFTQAGDEKIFAFGGFDYLVVISEAKFEGLIEIQTPKGNLDLKPGEQGALAIAKCQTKDGQPGEPDQILRSITRGLKDYYARRPQFT